MVKIYESCVLSTLLYGSESWRMTQKDMNKLSVFHLSCLRKICRIYWPQKVSNADVLSLTKQVPITSTITKRRWCWIGHTMRRERDNIARVALRWTPEGRRRRGRPKTTWRRTIEAEAQAHHKTWTDLEALAKDRGKWSAFVATSRRKVDE